MEDDVAELRGEGRDGADDARDETHERADADDGREETLMQRAFVDLQERHQADDALDALGAEDVQRVQRHLASDGVPDEISLSLIQLSFRL